MILIVISLTLIVSLSRQAKRLNKGLDLVVFFTTHDFKIKTDNYLELVESLSPKDSKIFNCDLRKLNYTDYLIDCTKGFRKFFLKEDEKDLPSARRQVMM